MKEGDVVAVHCNSCGTSAKHEVVGHHWWRSTEQNAAGAVLDLEHEYNLLVCDQCKSAQLRTAERIEQLSDEFTERYFPAHPIRVLPPWTAELPVHMGALLKETHIALANGYLWLVAMGSRTLIDMFALDRVGDVGGFNAKLNRLEKDAYLSNRDRIVVEAALEVGHEATHRNRCPSPQDCHGALEIVENLLHRLVIEIRACAIRENLPRAAS